MPTPDATLYRNPSVTIATIDTVLALEYARQSRTVVIPIPTGGTAIVVRPHGARSGTFRLGLHGADAQSRAANVEASLALGTLHRFSSDVPGGVGAFSWYVTGPLAVERVHTEYGATWIVSAEWTSQ